jgi:hypothetical protein
MFTQNCFIRIENDLSLIHKVSMMGYQPMYLNYKYNLMGKNLVLEHGTWHYTDSDNHPGAIDCGTNRELFLGIAAMNDVNDKDQYFKCAEDPDNFILCTTNTLREMFVYDKDLDLADENWQLYGKVTPQELVDYYTAQTSISVLSNPEQIGKN